MVATGAFSYVAFFVAARGMSSTDASTFVSWWAIVNTGVLALTIPLDTFAPRMRLDCERLEIPDVDRRRLIGSYALTVGVGFLVVVLCLALFRIIHISTYESIGVGMFGVSVAVTGGLRANLVAESRFTRFLFLSVVSSVVGATLLFVSFVNRPVSITEAFLVASTGGFVGWLMTKRWGADGSIEALGNREALRRLESTSPVAVLRRLSASTLVALMLSNGAVILGRFVGVTNENLIVYAAAVNIVLIPFMLLNTLTAPIHNRVVGLLREGKPELIKTLYRRSMISYLAIVTAMAFLSPIGLPRLVRLYIGDEYSLGANQSFFICMGEGLATVIALPRVFIVALGRTKRLTRVWAAGLIAFLLTMFAPVSVLTRMIAAPVVASVTILVLTQVGLRWNSRGPE